MLFTTITTGTPVPSQAPEVGDWGDCPGDEAGRLPEVTDAEEELWGPGGLDDFSVSVIVSPQPSGSALRPR